MDKAAMDRNAEISGQVKAEATDCKTVNTNSKAAMSGRLAATAETEAAMNNSQAATVKGKAQIQ